MEEPGSEIVVHLNRFCLKCGRYDLQVIYPEAAPTRVKRRERGELERQVRQRWLEAQRDKARRARAPQQESRWVCPHCGHAEFRLAHPRHQ